MGHILNKGEPPDATTTDGSWIYIFEISRRNRNLPIIRIKDSLTAVLFSFSNTYTHLLSFGLELHNENTVLKFLEP